MINGKDIYETVASIVPLYVAMMLGYGSVQWWKILTPEQCSGISRYISVFAVPALSLNFIYPLNPYHMNLKFLAGDTLQKIVALFVLFLWNRLSNRGRIDWTITLFSISTLPNTLLVGVPLLSAMYGQFTTTIMIQIVLMQSVVWYPFLLILYEYRAAKLFLSQQSITHASKPVDVTQEIATSIGMHHSIEISSNAKVSAEIEFENEDGAEYRSQQEVDIIEENENEYRRQQEVDNIEEIENKNRSQQKVDVTEEIANKQQQMPPPTNGTTKLILIRVWKKLRKNPNIYAAILGLTWSLIASRWHIKLPSMVRGSISIMSNTGLGMSMFSLGVFMASQPKIISCGKALVAISIAMKFLVGPAVMAATSAAIGIRGVLLHVGIIQAALPQGIVPFVFAREYNLHAEILSTSVMLGMAVTLPITIVYYAAIPEGIVPFVFAGQYNLHAEIISTAVVFGLGVGLPITIIYSVLLGL